jgi:hypothetical protein
MTRPIGKLQLRLLMGLSSPSMMMVVGDAVSASLVKRGLLRPNFPDDPEAFHRITPAGMRALADAYEAGQLEQFMKPLKRRSPEISPAYRATPSPGEPT